MNGRYLKSFYFGPCLLMLIAFGSMAAMIACRSSPEEISIVPPSASDIRSHLIGKKITLKDKLWLVKDTDNMKITNIRIEPVATSVFLSFHFESTKDNHLWLKGEMGGLYNNGKILTYPKDGMAIFELVE